MFIDTMVDKMSYNESEPGRTRTSNPNLRRIVLYPLSYRPRGVIIANAKEQWQGQHISLCGETSHEANNLR